MDNMKRRSSASLLMTIMAVCLLIAAFNLRPTLTSVATVLSEIQSDLQVSSVWTGILTTVPVLCFGAFGPLAPLLSSYLGLERAIFLLLVLLAVGLGLRVIPYATTLMLSALMAGAAIGMAGVLLPVIIRRDLPHQVGLVTGLYTMVLSLGGASAAGVTPIIEHTARSWTWALAFWGTPC